MNLCVHSLRQRLKRTQPTIFHPKVLHWPPSHLIIQLAANAIASITYYLLPRSMETWESRLNPTILQPFNLNKKCFPLLPSEHFLANTPLSAHPLMMHSKGAPPRSRFPNVARLRTCHLWRPATLSAREGISAVHLGQKQRKAKVTREIFVMQKKIFKKNMARMMFLLFKNEKFKMRWPSNDSFLFKQVSELRHAMQQLAEIHEPLLVWARSTIHMRWVDTEKLQHLFP